MQWDPQVFQLRVLECSQAMMQEGVCAKPFAHSKVKRWIKVLKLRSKCLEFSGWMLRRRDLHTQRNPFCRWYPALQMVLLSSQPCADQYRHLRKLPEARESLQRIRPRAPTLQVDSLPAEPPGKRREDSACCHKPDWKNLKTEAEYKVQRGSCLRNGG